MSKAKRKEGVFEHERYCKPDETDDEKKGV